MNKSGIFPVEYRVLVAQKEVKETTESGIIVPISKVEKDKFQVSEGTIVAAGAMAFKDPDWPVAPKVGDSILYDKYAGSLVKGLDGKEYRLIADKEVGAILGIMKR